MTKSHRNPDVITSVTEELERTKTTYAACYSIRILCWRVLCNSYADTHGLSLRAGQYSETKVCVPMTIRWAIRI